VAEVVLAYALATIRSVANIDIGLSKYDVMICRVGDVSVILPVLTTLGNISVSALPPTVLTENTLKYICVLPVNTLALRQTFQVNSPAGITLTSGSPRLVAQPPTYPSNSVEPLFTTADITSSVIFGDIVVVNSS
jgi:hypothetical protein